jgi:DNA-binding CsgD family transcriptional regulator
MRKPLNFDAMITEGAERWRKVGRGIDAAEKLVAAASNDPVSLIALAQAVLLFVRYKQNELQSYLREHFGIELDDPLVQETPHLSIRVVDEERARGRYKTLLDVAEETDVAARLMMYNTAWQAMERAIREGTSAWHAKEAAALWWARFGVARPVFPPNYAASAALAAYFHVMRNALIMYAPLVQRGKGPPPERRLEEATLGMLAAFVRSGIKMYPRLEAALAKHGDPQEVLLQELPGAAAAEIARLNAANMANAEEHAAFLKDLDKVKDQARRGAHKVLVNRVAYSLIANLGDDQRGDAIPEQLPSEEQELAAFFDQEYLRSLLKKAGLSAQELEVFRLCADLTNKEIAARLDRPQNQVAQEKFRAMQKLRQAAGL